jgi:hypothetical protein
MTHNPGFTDRAGKRLALRHDESARFCDSCCGSARG